MGMVLMSTTSSGLLLIDLRRMVSLFMYLNVEALDIIFNPVDRYLYSIRMGDNHIIKLPFNGTDTKCNSTNVSSFYHKNQLWFVSTREDNNETI